MANRRQIREATVQLIYARQSSPSSPSESDEEIWELILDRAQKSYQRARVKVLVHLQQGRAAVGTKLQQSLVSATSAIESAAVQNPAARKFQTFQEDEVKWTDRLEALPGLTKADTGNWRGSLETLFLESKKLAQKREELTPIVATFPPLYRDPILAVFTKLETFDERVAKVRSPEKHPEQRDLEHLHQQLAEMQSLRESTEEFVAKILAKLETIDPQIEAMAQNYDLKRLSRVDLSIIRLAAYEILKTDLPTAVAIDEAIELAKAFSGTEAASFVNGILDSIAKANP